MFSKMPNKSFFKTALATLCILSAVLLSPTLCTAEETTKKAGSKEIIKLTDPTEPEGNYKRYEWSIVSFYTNDAESKSIDSLMEGAKRIVEEKIENGEWHAR